ncbi:MULTISPECIES: UpxY family transcription antiterminator [Desulfococcus]|jgi:transcription elongation factor/antiterminator RfaH|uniref:NusG antitermination factor n=1 Tax=Desulfococcus multivorans DSM 2059 TaxID=1121405 RepID=S7TDU3_DESML|nr:UpxY family transcription antiterminator [Desulfococcus multivorans]AOY58213.1 NusG1: transcription antitermination protein [Desulfococcus multivorans]AQV00560.1 transcriptional antiterminator [Desulfococcus multivorans]EPR34851.1 NusG antitermination factor [Desulfococcus multivorans DSM 2059]MDX9818670.1 UpxY family transcription antiterminator [Desulfococcus multivorans]SJZ96550.1 transcription elongation factor/antiterminator RfaH [Desulfococcus multivorans DSM 2059]
MNDAILKPAWYVLHVKSRFENVVNEGLVKKSFEAFLPKIQVRSRRRDRRKMIQVPLFPGYLFVRTNLDPHLHLEIVRTVGAVRLVGNRTGPPVPVPDDVVSSLRIMVAAEKAVTTGRRYSKGERVMVTGGTLGGVVGVFSQYRGKGRVIVNIDILGQFAAVEVSEDDVITLPEIIS